MGNCFKSQQEDDVDIELKGCQYTRFSESVQVNKDIPSLIAEEITTSVMSLVFPNFESLTSKAQTRDKLEVCSWLLSKKKAEAEALAEKYIKQEMLVLARIKSKRRYPHISQSSVLGRKEQRRHRKLMVRIQKMKRSKQNSVGDQIQKKVSDESQSQSQSQSQRSKKPSSTVVSDNSLENIASISDECYGSCYQ